MSENQDNKNQSKVVSDRILSILTVKNISKKALSEYLDVSENGLKKMMDNGSYKMTTLWKIAEFLQVDPVELLFDKPSEIPKQGEVVQDSITELVSVLKQQAEAILKNSNSIENQTLVIKQNAFTIEAQRAQIAELSNKGVRKDLDHIMQSLNVLMRDQKADQKKKTG